MFVVVTARIVVAIVRAFIVQVIVYLHQLTNVSQSSVVMDYVFTSIIWGGISSSVITGVGAASCSILRTVLTRELLEASTISYWVCCPVTMGRASLGGFGVAETYSSTSYRERFGGIVGIGGMWNSLLYLL